MGPEEILKEYEKGCGCAESKPSDCRECFDAAVRAIVAYKDAELATLRAENERLREALEFYADRDYDGYDVTFGDYNLSMSVGVIIQDAGDRAKEALK